jgi:hypothetical protein
MGTAVAALLVTPSATEVETEMLSLGAPVDVTANAIEPDAVGAMTATAVLDAPRATAPAADGTMRGAAVLETAAATEPVALGVTWAAPLTPTASATTAAAAMVSRGAAVALIVGEPEERRRISITPP